MKIHKQASKNKQTYKQNNKARKKARNPPALALL